LQNYALVLRQWECINGDQTNVTKTNCYTNQKVAQNFQY